MPTLTDRAQDPFRILIADDEPDILTVTKLTLRNLSLKGRPLEFLSASSGAQTIEVMRREPDVAVILLDVVMESSSAGLDACRTIREELANPFVRILLRTGQPGAAPERATIDNYDIDDYLSKAEMTSSRLYTAVRTSLKAYGELIELERYRKCLEIIHECAISLRSFEPLESTLRRVLSAVLSLCPTPLAVLNLETFEGRGNPRRFFLYRSSDPDDVRGEAAANAAHARITAAGASRAQSGTMPAETGLLVPIHLQRELGHGWIYVQTPDPNPLLRKLLPVLAAHAANALYSSVAQTILVAEQDPVFEAMAI